MARKRNKADQHPGELNLTAMIDVAFQLLAFFLVAIKPVDVFANLEANRPSPSPVVPGTPFAMIRVMVLPGQYVVNDVPLSLAQLESRLERYAATDATQTVLSQCARNSTHQQLVELLDRCARFRMSNISVVNSAGIYPGASHEYRHSVQ